MKAILYHEIAIYDDETEKGTLVELTKELELGFVPSAGMYFQMRPNLSGIPEKDALYESVLEDAVQLPGIIRIERVYYDVDDDMLVLHSTDSYESVSVLSSIIDQLVLGYGFERND